MQIAVTFRHMEAEERAKGYVKGKVQRLQKYIENPKEVADFKPYVHIRTKAGMGLLWNS